MYFKVCSFSFIMLVSVFTFSFDAHGCLLRVILNDNYMRTKNTPHCGAVERFQNENGTVYFGGKVTEGQYKAMNKRTPYNDRIQYYLTDPSAWPHVDYLSLSYSVRTVDGTAKAGKDYKSINNSDHHGYVKWEAYPRARSRDHSMNELWVQGESMNDIGLQTYVNDEDRRGLFRKGTYKYFYVIYEPPRLFMKYKKCQKWVITLSGRECKKWTQEQSPYENVYGNYWEPKLQNGHNTPRKLIFLVYIKQL